MTINLDYNDIENKIHKLVKESLIGKKAILFGFKTYDKIKENIIRRNIFIFFQTEAFL